MNTETKFNILEACDKAITKAWDFPADFEGYETDHISMMRYIIYLSDEAPHLIKQKEACYPEKSTIIFLFMAAPGDDHFTWEALEIQEINFMKVLKEDVGLEVHS